MFALLYSLRLAGTDGSAIEPLTVETMAGYLSDEWNRTCGK
jgi:hypothetical protein